jgi:hypothetical protein
MAEIITIDIQVNLYRENEIIYNREKLLSIPESIEVPQFSIVQWNIINFEKYREKTHRLERSLIFTLYFDKDSPFNWKRNFVQLYDFPFGPFYPKTIRLAEGVADVKGEFKYGVSVFDAEQNEPVYDEDPILKVI